MVIGGWRDVQLRPIGHRVANPIGAAGKAARKGEGPTRVGALPHLAAEIERNLVSVEDRVDRSIVTILGDGLFKPGDVTVTAAKQPLILRIADALTKVPGQVDVIGHTDNVPIRTLRFPSNFELSTARAESVAGLLATRVPPSRLRSVGRGESEPIASNDAPDGRAKNRRVEIIVYVPASAGSSPAAQKP